MYGCNVETERTYFLRRRTHVSSSTKVSAKKGSFSPPARRPQRLLLPPPPAPARPRPPALQLQPTYKLRKRATHPEVACRDGIGYEVRTATQPTGDGVVPYPSLAFWRHWVGHPLAHAIDAFELDGVGHRPIMAHRHFHALALALVCAHGPSQRPAGAATARWYASTQPALAGMPVVPATPLPATPLPIVPPPPSLPDAAPPSPPPARLSMKRASMDADWRDPASVSPGPWRPLPDLDALALDADGLAADPTTESSYFDLQRVASPDEPEPELDLDDDGLNEGSRE